MRIAVHIYSELYGDRVSKVRESQFLMLISTRQIAEAHDDRRDSALTAHSLVSMIRQRIYGIIADYERIA